jgi:hypothetical protein
MPGMALTGFDLDMTGPVPVPFTEISATPYKTRMLGIDFESFAGNIGFRGEAAWSDPYKSFKSCEYIPLPEIAWVTGIDWSSGNWRLTGEYSGKVITSFEPEEADPVIGTEPDYVRLAEIMATPGFNFENYVRMQVGAFNRLYNYQLARYYHSAGIRVESGLIYGKLTPAVYSLYNFTSHDLLIIPELRFKPSDGFTLTAGAEFYYGSSGSLFDIVDDFMNSFFFSLRIDF